MEPSFQKQSTTLTSESLNLSLSKCWKVRFPQPSLQVLFCWRRGRVRQEQGAGRGRRGAWPRETPFQQTQHLPLVGRFLRPRPLLRQRQRRVLTCWRWSRAGGGTEGGGGAERVLWVGRLGSGWGLPGCLLDPSSGSQMFLKLHHLLSHVGIRECTSGSMTYIQ